MDSLFYDMKELQTLMHIGKNEAYKLIQLKGFPSMRLGNKILIPKEDFQKWFETNKCSTIYL